MLISEQHDGYKHTWSKIYFPFKYKSNYHSVKLSSNLLRELHLWELQDENCWILVKSRLCGVAVAKSSVSYAVFLWTCVGLSSIFLSVALSLLLLSILKAPWYFTSIVSSQTTTPIEWSTKFQNHLVWKSNVKYFRILSSTRLPKHLRSFQVFCGVRGAQYLVFYFNVLWHVVWHVCLSFSF